MATSKRTDMGDLCTPVNNSERVPQIIRNVAFILFAGIFLGFFDILLNGPSYASLFNEIYQADLGIDTAITGFLGYLLGGILLTAFPGFFEKHHRAAINTSVAIGIGSIALRYFSLGSNIALGVTGVFVSGLMLPFSKSLFFYNISLLKNVTVLVLSASIGQVGKIILETAIVGMNPNQQILLLLAAAIVCTVSLAFLGQLRGQVRFSDTRELIVKKDMTWSYLIGQMVIITLITALFRAYSTFNEFPADFGGILLEAAVYLLIPIGCYYAFVFSKTEPSSRLRNALLLLLLGMFVLMSQSSSTWVLSDQSVRQLAHFFRSFALVTCWCVIVSASWINKKQSVRIFGINIIIFCITSIIWMLVFKHNSGVAPILIGVAIYICFLASNKFFPNNQTIQDNDWQRAASERLTRMADEYGLSSRETDIFLLLAQGRSRHAIAESLYLSDGTIKGYVSRIYHKLGVAGKDELLELVQRFEEDN